MTDSPLLKVLSDLVVVVHLGYAGFVVVGFLLILAGAFWKWRWIRNRVFRLVHLGCISLVAIEVVVGQICPLTLLENWLLVAAGQAGYQRTFIGQLIYDLLYYDFPTWVFTVTYLSLAGLTVLTLVLIPPVWRAAPGQETEPG